MNKQLEKIFLTLIKISTIVILFLPFVVIKSVLYPYVFGKSIIFQILVEISFVLWIFLAIYNKKYRPNYKNLLILSLTFFVSSLILTMFTGIDIQSSFFSKAERMTGILALLHFYLWFLVLINTFKHRKDWKIFVWTSLVCSFWVGMYGLGQKLGFHFLIRNGEPRMSATLGNPIFLGVYSMLHIFLAAFIVWSEKEWKWRALSIFILLFNLIIVLLSASRSVMITLVLSLFLFLFYLISNVSSKRTKPIFISSFIILIIIIIGGLIFLQTQQRKDWIYKAPYFVYRMVYFTEGLTKRIIPWKIGLQGFLERPIFGWGWGNYNIVFNKFYSPEILRGGEAATWFDHSHNQLVDLLALTGSIGFLAYLFFYSSIFILIFKKIKTLKKQTPEGSKKNILSLTILSLMFLAYFLQNLTVFDTPAPLIIFYFGLGLVYFSTTAIDKSEAGESEQEKNNIISKKFPLPILILLTVIFLPLSLYYFNLKPLIASREAIKGLSLIEVSSTKGLEFYKKSLSRNTFINPEIRLNLIKNLVEKKIINKGLLEEDEIKFIISEMEKNIVEHPKDARYYIYLGQLYNLVGQREAEYLTKAEDVLAVAKKLSPQRQQIYYALANTKILKKDIASAIELLKEAVDLDPQVGESHKLLGLLYLQNQQKEEGLAEIEEAEKTLDIYQDSSFTLYIATAYFETGNTERAIFLSEHAQKIDPNNPQVYIQLSVLYKEIGDKEKAISAVKKAIELNPVLAEEGEKFIKSMDND